MTDENTRDIIGLVDELKDAFTDGSKTPKNEVQQIAKRIIAKGPDAMPGLFNLVVESQTVHELGPDYPLVACIYEALGRKGAKFLFEKLRSEDSMDVLTSAEILSFGRFKSASAPLLELLDRAEQKNILDDYGFCTVTYALVAITPREKRPAVASRLLDSLINYIETNSPRSPKGYMVSTVQTDEFQRALYNFGDVLPTIIKSRLNEMKMNEPKKSTHIRAVLAGLCNEIINMRSKRQATREISVDKEFAKTPSVQAKDVPKAVQVKAATVLPCGTRMK